MLAHLGEQAVLNSRDHNATSYSTETAQQKTSRNHEKAEIITLRAIALKRDFLRNITSDISCAEIITLRAIALKQSMMNSSRLPILAEIITLRAIALKLSELKCAGLFYEAEIITLRAIALKHKFNPLPGKLMLQRS